MLIHIVLFKLKDNSAQAVTLAKERLASLPGKIPQVRFFEIGVDILHEGRSYDISLYSKFDSLADLREYQAHPAHQEFLAWFRPQFEASAAVDYEQND